MHDTETPAILITGSGPHLGQLAQMADAVSSNRLVWTGAAGTPPEWAAAVGGRAISSITDVRPDTIVIGGRTGDDGNFVFPPNSGVWRLPTSCHAVHHPIVLSDLLPLDFSGKIVSCGYPGSGNGIVQAIIERIYPTTALPVSAFQNLLSAYVADYLNSTIKILSNLGARLGNAEPAFATYREHYASAHWRHRDIYGDMHGSTLFGLPLHNYMFESIHKSHEICGKKIQRLCITSGAKCILTVRNPLDILVSIANKSWRLVTLLDTEWLLRAVSRGLIAYYRSFYDSLPEAAVHVIRYEELVDNFEQTIAELALALGMLLTREEIADIRTTLWNRSVASPGHLWKPGQGKWKEYLTKRNIEILREEGLPAIFEKLGYEFPLIADVSESSTAVFEWPIRPTVRGVSFFSNCIGTVDTTLAEFSANVSDCLFTKAGRMIFVSTSASALSAFDQFASKTDFLELVAAAEA
jgi:hypothetical protein